MKTATALLLALVSTQALAQRISVGPFSGPGADGPRTELLNALCNTATCVEKSKVTTGAKVDWGKAKKEKVLWVVTGKVTGKGKKRSLEVQAANGPGAPRFKKVVALGSSGELSGDAAQALAGALSSKLGLREASAAQPVASATPPVASSEPAAEPAPRSPTMSEPPEPVVPGEVAVEPEAPRARQAKHPVASVEVAADLLRRTLTYANVGAMNLRSYEAAFVFAPSLWAEFFPLALLLDQGVLRGLGVEGGAAFALGLRSRRAGTEVAYPTSMLRIDVALKWRFEIPQAMNLSVTPFFGYRLHSFSVGAGSDGSTIDGLPGVAYSALRIGAQVELPFGDSGLRAFARFSVLPALGAGELISAAYFPRGSTFGLDLGVGVGFQLTRWLQLRGGFDYLRYGSSFQTQATDTFIADGAGDVYLGGRLAVRFTF